MFELVQTDQRTIWLADDDEETRAYLSEFLVSRSYTVVCFDSGEQVIQQLASAEPSLLLLDVRMPRVGGLEVLERLHQRGSRIPSIVLSGMDQIPTVVNAMRLGAYDYLVKPINSAELERAIETALERAQGTVEVNPVGPEAAFRTSNKRMLHIQAICDQLARVDVPVLILGESGVGKEVMARYIHVT